MSPSPSTDVARAGKSRLHQALKYSASDLARIGDGSLRSRRSDEAVISDRDLEILAWVCVTFLRTLKNNAMFTSFADDRKNQGAAPNNLVGFATDDDMAFMVLVLEQHIDTWEETNAKIAECGESGKTFTRKEAKDSKKDKWTKNGLSGAVAQKRFGELRKYFGDLFMDDSDPTYSRKLERLYTKMYDEARAANGGEDEENRKRERAAAAERECPDMEEERRRMMKRMKKSCRYTTGPLTSSIWQESVDAAIGSTESVNV